MAIRDADGIVHEHVTISNAATPKTRYQAVCVIWRIQNNAAEVDEALSTVRVVQDLVDETVTCLACIGGP